MTSNLITIDFILKFKSFDQFDWSKSGIAIFTTVNPGESFGLSWSVVVAVS